MVSSLNNIINSLLSLWYSRWGTEFFFAHNWIDSWSSSASSFCLDAFGSTYLTLLINNWFLISSIWESRRYHPAFSFVSYKILNSMKSVLRIKATKNILFFCRNWKCHKFILKKNQNKWIKLEIKRGRRISFI